MILTRAFSTIQFIVYKIALSTVISLAITRSIHLVIIIDVNLGNQVCLKSCSLLVV